MNEKIKLNKSELTKLKKEEKNYLQFLPVLKLKQEQLQIESIKIKKNIKEKKQNFIKENEKIEKFVSLFNDINLNINLKEKIKIFNTEIIEKSVAGIKLPYIKKITFKEEEICFFELPTFIIQNIENIKKLLIINKELDILNKQSFLLNKELKKTIQRINLFEKILIPKNKEYIKKIKIVLSDEQVAAVGRGKIAKKKNK